MPPSSNPFRRETPEYPIPEGTKRCSECDKILPLQADFFHQDPNSADGFRNECRLCRNKALKKDLAKNSTDFLTERKKQFDEAFLSFVDAVPEIASKEPVPHMTLLYERYMHYFGGADGLARHTAMVYLSGTPAIRARILSKVLDLGITVSKEGHAKVPLDLLEKEDLERELSKRLKQLGLPSPQDFDPKAQEYNPDGYSPEEEVIEGKYEKNPENSDNKDNKTE